MLLSTAGRWRLPGPLTPFSAIDLLERIRHEELVRAIRALERRYFTASNGNEAAHGHADLRTIAEGWLQ